MLQDVEKFSLYKAVCSSVVEVQGPLVNNVTATLIELPDVHRLVTFILKG